MNCIAQGIGTEGVSAMDELWNLEKSFWTGGAETYEARLCLEALMILPPPAGVLDRAATIDAIRAAERWARVTFSQKHVLRPADAVASSRTSRWRIVAVPARRIRRSARPCTCSSAEAGGSRRISKRRSLPRRTGATDDRLEAPRARALDQS